MGLLSLLGVMRHLREGDHHYVLDNANLGPEQAGAPRGCKRRHLTEEFERDGVRRRLRGLPSAST